MKYVQILAVLAVTASAFPQLAPFQKRAVTTSKATHTGAVCTPSKCVPVLTSLSQCVTAKSAGYTNRPDNLACFSAAHSAHVTPGTACAGCFVPLASGTRRRTATSPRPTTPVVTPKPTPTPPTSPKPSTPVVSSPKPSSPVVSSPIASSPIASSPVMSSPGYSSGGYSASSYGAYSAYPSYGGGYPSPSYGGYSGGGGSSPTGGYGSGPGASNPGSYSPGSVAYSGNQGGGSVPYNIRRCG